MSGLRQELLDLICDRQELTARDPLGMMDLVLGFPEQCRIATRIGAGFGAGPSCGEVRQVVLTGLGGSAIGGDFARGLVDAFGTVPMIVNRDYTLPAWVGPETLVVAASYSGNTEETISAYGQAAAAGAALAVITSGGRLAELAARDGVPVAIVPGGQPPRSATGFMFFPLLHLLTSRGLLDRSLTSQVGGAISRLESMAARLGPAVPTERNPAKQLAAALCGRIPVIYGSQGIRGAIAVRWKGQFNENAKLAAFANVLPEQNHVEALAWVTARKQADNWSVVFLRDPGEVAETPRIARRVEITRELIGADTPTHEVWAEGTSFLERMFSLIYFGDFVTVYAAILNEVCPTDMGLLEYLKAELAKLV
ncbi:MAG TPA: bifunctional phosphoglucose/phosphomannose isomerase [Chthonomonadaceae bacterium]|nr:bifunctional phosphoglucose/phosphomannose isomerase [Chthonomonadaceae bacterium]